MIGHEETSISYLQAGRCGQGRKAGQGGTMGRGRGRAARGAWRRDRPRARLPPLPRPLRRAIETTSTLELQKKHI